MKRRTCSLYGYWLPLCIDHLRLAYSFRGNARVHLHIPLPAVRTSPAASCSFCIFYVVHSALRRGSRCTSFLTARCCAVQAAAGGAERGVRRDHVGTGDLELRRGRHAGALLARTAARAAGLPHHHLVAHGAHVHQVPARLDHVGAARLLRHLRCALEL